MSPGIIIEQSDPYLIFVMKVALIIECITVPGNLFLIILFIYTLYRERIKRRKRKIPINEASINLTYILLFIGFGFSICQGLIENWLINDCTVDWLAWTTFTFYIFHRVILLYIFLHRLYLVFQNTTYKYPICYIYTLAVFIFIFGIISLFIYSFDYSIIPSTMGWKTFNGGEILCAWAFGHFVNC